MPTTDERTSGATGLAFDPGTPWQASPSVALRPEPFGALAYDFTTRRLSFLKSRRLVDVVRALAGCPTADAALDAAQVPDAERAAYVRALATLAESGLVVPRPDPAGGPRWSPRMSLVDLAPAPRRDAPLRLVDQFELGLDAPICLTWELTYACNLACVHCLSSSGRRDPRELTTAQAEAVVDELQRMQVFYVNIGGGEPTVRPDFWHLLDYAVDHQVGVKFSTNGIRITPERAARIAATDYVDVQVSLDGATAEVNDAVRGDGSYATAVRALENLAGAGFADSKISVVVTRQNVGQLDQFKELADRFGATLRLTRLRPSGRGADVWNDLHPTAAQQRDLYAWLVRAGEGVLTGDSFFHLAPLGEALPGLNLCGAGRVVALIDPVGDVYACPFAIHDSFLAGNVLSPGGFERVWKHSDLFTDLRRPTSGGVCTSCAHYDACRGGCMAAKFFTGLPLDGPDPECVQGYGEQALAAVPAGAAPRPGDDHSHTGPVRGQARRPVPVVLGRTAPPVRGCDESPLADLATGRG